MHYEKDESAPTERIDILRERAEVTLPPLYDTLIAEFQGRMKWKGEEESLNGIFSKM